MDLLQLEIGMGGKHRSGQLHQGKNLRLMARDRREAGAGGHGGGGGGQLATGGIFTLLLGPTGVTLLRLIFAILPWWVSQRAADPMSPLFPCCSCGVQIERSIKLYRQRKGKVLCSTCQDRAEALQAREAGSLDPGETGAPAEAKENG